mmetsp:Transcript_16416/g.27607  ORF Transcript_16416/g.27607 Transcript_16416/m.27607 type:complete len:515 (+) Transcript_16416:420-1964(+)|eukprot:CAMPEP_0198215566 /NCGR_PEP_ID=MMETSP1445-20131203/50860_1 /TAXON_ID=36898 /ORGANISM="Pyramimonas sp., Strain CCMP2087" /LENGTH=514 /DNA_ID=CAMNT_0043891357 /DNA_START=161 /DNA_END=1705 /DNA_ORIENTATION=+
MQCSKDSSVPVRGRAVLRALRDGYLGTDSEELADVHLVGLTEGAPRVPAIRAHLAVRSAVFRRMLYGEFSESQDKVVSLQFENETIQRLVEFCYTGEIPSLFRQDETGQLSVDHIVADGAGVIDCIALMVDLGQASDFFDLPELADLVGETLTTMLANHPELACAVLQETTQRISLQTFEANTEPHTSMQAVMQAALKTICQQPDVLLAKKAAYTQDALEPVPPVCRLSPNTLRVVLSSQTLNATEYFLYQVLSRWATHNQEDVEGVKVAREIMQDIDLSLIAPSLLVAEVSPTGLISPEALAAAFQKQALDSERRHGVGFTHSKRINRRNPMFNKPTWDSVHHTDFVADDLEEQSVPRKWTVECVRGVVFAKGLKYTWRLQILELCCLTWAGVVATPYVNNVWAGKQPFGWMYGSNGAACHDTKQDNGPYDQIANAGFAKGDILTFTLDLTQAHDGVLMVAIDKEVSTQPMPGVLVFQNMLSKQSSASKQEFLPAVCLRKPGAVRILSIECDA